MVLIQKSLSGIQEDLIIPGRRYIRDGVLSKVCRKSNKPRAFFLFSDILIYASLSNSASSSGGPTFTFHRKIPLDNVRAVAQPDAEGARNALSISSRNKSFVVLAETAAARDAWVSDINTAANKLRQNRSTLKLEINSAALNLEQSIGTKMI